MPGNENTKSGILQGLFICRTSELNPRNLETFVLSENIFYKNVIVDYYWDPNLVGAPYCSWDMKLEVPYKPLKRH